MTTFVVIEQVQPTLTRARVLEQAWNDKCAVMQSDDLYRLLNVRLRLVCEDRKQYLVVEDVWAFGVIGESNRFTLPLLSDFGEENDRFDTLALHEDKARWSRGWTPHGLEIPGRQSFHVALLWQQAFLLRYREIIGQKHVDVRAVFAKVR